jgi:hypothetical protein
VWASIGWGGLSTVAGALISHTSVRSGLCVYVAMSAPAVAAAWLLKHGPRQQASGGGGGGSSGGSSGGSGSGGGGSGGSGSSGGGSGGGGSGSGSRAAAEALPGAADAAQPDGMVWASVEGPQASTGKLGSSGSGSGGSSSPKRQPRPSRLSLPLSFHAPQGGGIGGGGIGGGPAASDAGCSLRTRLLAAAARTPSPAPPASPRGPADASAALAPPCSPLRYGDGHGTALLPLILCPCAGEAEPAAAGSDVGDGSWCSTPRSTAALLDCADGAPPSPGAPLEASAVPKAPAPLALGPLLAQAAAADAFPAAGCYAAIDSADARRPGDAAAPAQPGAAGGRAAQLAAGYDAAADATASVTLLAAPRGEPRKAPLAACPDSSSADTAAAGVAEAAAGAAQQGPAAARELESASSAKGVPAAAAAAADDGGSVAALLLQPRVATFLLRALMIGLGLGVQVGSRECPGGEPAARPPGCEPPRPRVAGPSGTLLHASAPCTRCATPKPPARAPLPSCSCASSAAASC